MKKLFIIDLCITIALGLGSFLWYLDQKNTAYEAALVEFVVGTMFLLGLCCLALAYVGSLKFFLFLSRRPPFTSSVLFRKGMFFFGVLSLVESHRLFGEGTALVTTGFTWFLGGVFLLIFTWASTRKVARRAQDNDGRPEYWDRCERPYLPSKLFMALLNAYRLAFIPVVGVAVSGEVLFRYWWKRRCLARSSV
jgi:hypothetical protein